MSDMSGRTQRLLTVTIIPAISPGMKIFDGMVID